MDIIVGSSRARDMGSGLTSYNIEKYYKPGGKILDMKELIDNHKIYNHGTSPLFPGEKFFVYTIVGICDITTKINNRKNNHCEIIYDQDYSENILTMQDHFLELESHIIANSLIPVFGTIVPVHLEKANNFLFDHGKTKFLKHSLDYYDMQTDILKVINAVNDFLTLRNDINNVNTLALHTTVLHNVKKGKKHLRHIDLFDGVHPNSKLSLKWNNILRQTINNNRK